MTKKQIQYAFEHLLEGYQIRKKEVITKEELAAKENQSQLLATAKTYTPDSIIKGLGDLQLTFTEHITNWAKKLEDESHKRQEIQEAIEIEQKRLAILEEVKLAADVLYLLQEEHHNLLKELQEEHQTTMQELAQERQESQKEHEKEVAAFHEKCAETERQEQKQRVTEEDAFDYHWQKRLKLEADAFTEKKRKAEREVADLESLKNADWAARQEKLDQRKAQHEKNLQAIAEFEEKLKNEVNKAREKAATETSREVKAEAELIAKEEEANAQIFAGQIEDLQARIEKNKGEIESLTAQMAQAVEQVKSLSIKALENSRVTA
ncbi:hypothetical protein [Hugenholtzia roseola]|uniref:hypothetical protein n=1 Tax=Hugenholtzia roseola TaxID=1002 RepID=UPI0004068FA2|nr:hypothetical protein [Hugenholtzia roseola]